MDPQFHCGAWGGAKGAARYGPEVEDVIRFLLWQEVKADPLRTIKQFTEVMHAAGWLVSHDWINRTFKTWGVSRQRPTYKNLNKFTTSNFLYYRYLSFLLACVLCLQPSVLVHGVVCCRRSAFVLHVKKKGRLKSNL